MTVTELLNTIKHNNNTYHELNNLWELCYTLTSAVNPMNSLLDNDLQDLLEKVITLADENQMTIYYENLKLMKQITKNY